MGRGEKTPGAGADGIFVEAPQSLEELQRVAHAFDVLQLANMLEDDATAMLSPVKLAAFGDDRERRQR